MELRVLGPVQVHLDGRQVQLPGSRPRAVLGVLALHANRVVPSQRLLELVWGPAPPKTARNSLQGQVSRLRRLLGSDGDQDRLVYREPGYLLRVGPGELDLEEFRRLTDEGRRLLAVGDAGRGAPLLHRALSLWHGRPLEDADLPAMHEQVAGLEERRLAALEDRIEADLRLGRHGYGELEAELEALVAVHPLRERLRGQQMLALYRAGRVADALAVFRETHAVLGERLGVDPGPDLVRLQRAMLARDPSLELPSEAQKPAADVGREVVPAQLPAAVSSFVGRARHLHQLDRLLEDDGPAAVVISALAGMAGVGKTALAVRWAQRVRERFADGQLYVDLRGWAHGPPLSPVQALAGFLGALRVPAERVPTEVEQAAGLYRSLLAGRRMLVVLDNARSVEQVRPLLPGSPGCVVLVTSRERLGGLVARDGAHPLAVDVLTAEEACELLAGVLGAERVEAEPQAAVELARSCAHLPLAVRIAAANLAFHRERSIAELAAELAEGNRLATLAVEGDEQAAVRAAFDLSYRALDPEAQRLFRLLGLVPGPDFTAEAAAALADATPEDAAALLGLLTDAHLLAQPAPGRYVLHDLLRAYAAERVQPTERDPALGTLLDWYLHSADAAARRLYPEKLRLPLPSSTAQAMSCDDHTKALEWLDAERPNLVAVVQHAATNGLHPAAWLLADTLRGYFALRMYTVDWLAVAHAGLAAAEGAADSRGQAAAHLSLADVHLRLGGYQQTIEHCNRALTLAREGGWLEGESTARSNLGLVCLDLGRLEEAAEHFAQALAIDRRTGRLAGQATRLCNLGNVSRDLGRLAQSAEHHTEALALFRRVGSRSGEAGVLANLGETCHALGRLDQALDHLTGALVLLREVGDRGVEGETLRLLAAVHRDAGRLTLALEAAEGAVALARDTGDRQYETVALDTLATVHQRRGQPEQARARAEQALAVAREAGYQLLEGQVLTTLASIHLELDQPEQARQHAQQALALHRATGHRLGHARTLVTLGRALRHTDGTEAALPCWREALSLFTDAGSPEADQVHALLRAARLQPSTAGTAARRH